MSIIPHDDIPNELWMDIFEIIGIPQDLLAVVLTCKKFYDCGIRTLLRNLVWTTPQDVARNLSVCHYNRSHSDPNHLDVEPVLAADVRSLALGVSSVSESLQVTFIDENNIMRLGPLAQTNMGAAEDKMMSSLRMYQVDHYAFATASLYASMCQRILSFTNLEKFECKDLIFTDELFDVIYSLPGLRKLHIEFCIFPKHQAAQHRDHSVLPITELKLLNLRRHVNVFRMYGMNVEKDEFTHVLNLSLAPNLRSLHIDSTADVLRRVFGVWLRDEVFHIPQYLERLYVSDRSYHWGYVLLPYEGEYTPARVLFELFKSSTMQTISLPFQLYNTRLPRKCLPNLRNVEGLDKLVQAMGERSPLRAISLLWSGELMYDTLGVLEEVAHAHGTALKMLAVERRYWDETVLHDVCALFPNLRRLKLTYWEEGPSEDAIDSVGPLLSRLPDLHTFQMYQTRRIEGISEERRRFQRSPIHSPDSLHDPSIGCIEDEMRDLVTLWNIDCPSLRVVQLSAGWKMSRAEFEEGWEMEKVGEYMSEDFSY